MPGDRVLVVEDDPSLREVIAFQLGDAGCDVIRCADGAEAIAFLTDQPPPAVVITDVKMPRADGFEVLAAARRLAPQTPVLMITAFGSVELAVEAMRKGAFDFVSKPFHKDQLLLTVDKAREHWRLATENARLKQRVTEHDEIIAVSASMREVLQQARQVAQTSATVLLLGESGTGKEVIAREIHRCSDRAASPLVALNCAAIPRDLLESELFGHARGAFTGATRERQGRFAAADGGTLFLDEIGDLDEALQAKLLRVLEERRVDVVGGGSIAVNVRIIAATHQDLASLVREGRFRQDLFFRLSVVPLRLPALRARRQDIPVLFGRYVRQFGGPDLKVTPALFAALEARAWPGNVRELRNVAERMVALRRADVLDATDLPAEDAPAMAAEPLELDPARLRLPADGISLEELEKAVVIHAIEHNGGNLSAAARFLRVPRHILVYRMEKFGISRGSAGRKPGA
ncbi:MAG: sigma-54-dependent Fis family transcriptional regulator [Deltaproteobacteria bacterium]|nr:sigma-54-dependent Fis family transcriptional regulator [Deltaproteobacteria bacterium]